MTLNNSTVVIAITAVGFYALVIILSAIKWKSNRPDKTGSGTMLYPIWIALALHAVFLQRLVSLDSGINTGFASDQTLFAWCATLVAVLISWRTRIIFLAVVLSALSAFSILIALMLPSNATNSDPMSFALVTHIIISVLSYSLLCIAAVIAVLLGLQDYQLHHHLQGKLLKLLPPLQTMESLMFRLIEGGFVLLSFSLLSGFAFTTDWFNHKIVFSSIAWMVFFVLLLGRHYAGWRGRIAIRWTLFGLLSLMLAFFGTKLVFEFILQR